MPRASRWKRSSGSARPTARTSAGRSSPTGSACWSGSRGAPSGEPRLMVVDDVIDGLGDAQDTGGGRAAALVGGGAGVWGTDERLRFGGRADGRSGVVLRARRAEADVRSDSYPGRHHRLPWRCAPEPSFARGELVGARAPRSRQALSRRGRRADPCRRRCLDDGRGRRVRRALRPQRLGQDDAAGADRRAAAPRRRHRAGRRPRHLRALASRERRVPPAPARHHRPAPQPDSRCARGRERLAEAVALQQARAPGARSSRCWSGSASASGCSTAPSSCRWASASAC